MTTTAKRVLEQCWDGKLPVDPKRIAGALGMHVRENPWMAESGRVDYVNGQPVVDYNSTEAAVRQRFTIAHEIGHFALGHTRGGARKFRDPASNFSSGSYEPEEREANAFAAQLLMPADTVRYAVQNKGITNVARLAQLFGVSQVAMKYRLQNLGLIRE